VRRRKNVRKGEKKEAPPGLATSWKRAYNLGRRGGKGSKVRGRAARNNRPCRRRGAFGCWREGGKSALFSYRNGCRGSLILSTFEGGGEILQ